MNTPQTIPVMDLTDFDAGGVRRARFVKAMGDALVDIGFFSLVGHGVDNDLIGRAYEVAREFFDMPEAKKLSYEIPGVHGQRGYTSFGKEHAKDSAAPDLKEFWHVGQELPAGPRKMEFPKNTWPAEQPDFRPVFLDLFRQLEDCAMKLLRAGAIYLGETEGRLSSIANGGSTILRVIHYPPIPEGSHPASIRAAAHEDINLITLLCEATAGGLELLERNGSWRPIHALKGQIVVDAGDMLQNITNGFFKSTTHRVVNPDNSRERRFSMPFFVHPRPEASLDPLPDAVARTGGEPAFPSITAGEYLARRLAEIGLSQRKD